MEDRGKCIIEIIAGNNIKVGDWVYKQGKNFISYNDGNFLTDKQCMGLAASSAEQGEKLDVIIKGVWAGKMARFCEKHMARATLTLVDRRDGTEYDLCATCEAELAEILNAKPTEGEESGRKRIVGRPKAVKK